MAKREEQTSKKPASNLRSLLEKKKSAATVAAKTMTATEKKDMASTMTQAPIKRGEGGQRKAK